jgi:TonB-dependent starch-binding outer membrane protein SusC
MKQTLRCLWLALLLLGAQEALAQRTITGKVLSGEDNSPLPGVNVLIKGTTVGTATDADGIYKLSLPAGSNVLVFSSIGFLTQEVDVGNRSVVDLTLATDAKTITEVVVVGYGEQDRRTVTSSIASVSAKELKDMPVPSADQLLQGRASGVQIGAQSGTPGGGMFVRVRGTTSITANNDPLYIVDGVFMNNSNLSNTGLGGQVTNPIADLNPADIESMEVLKDANATAIYGARGANGVVIITTKRGKLNSGTKVNLGYYKAFSSAWRLPEVVDGPTFGLLQNEARVNTNADRARQGLAPLTPLVPYPNPEQLPTFNRFTGENGIFQTAPTDNVDLNVTGGNEKTTFYVGGSLFRQEAIVKPSIFQRASARINIDHNISKKFKFGISSTFARTNRNLGQNDNNINGVLGAAVFIPTIAPIFNDDGTYARDPRFSLFENSVAGFREVNFNAVGTRVIGNAYAEYHIIDGLTFKTSWSLDLNDFYENNYFSTQLNAGQSGGQGRATSDLSRDITWINEQTLNFNKTFGDHSLNALIGNTLQENKFERTSITGNNFPNNSFRRIASSAIQSGSSTGTMNGLTSFFGRVGYGYKGKYLIDASARSDASSRFGANRRRGFFPSVGVAWRVGEEAFLDQAEWISELKLRASYGITGNQNGIGDFASRGLWGGGIGAVGINNNANYLGQPGVAPSQLANPELSWETTRQWNIGADFGIMEGRFVFDFNIYNKYTTGLLLDVPVPRTTGFESITQNFGEMSNRGLEFSVNSTNISTSNFRWTTTFNIARNVNKIERMPAPIVQYTRELTRLEQGVPMYSFWLWNQTGVNPQTGDAVYEDVNNDGNITVADRKIVGNNWPDFFGGMNNTVTYKGFDFNMFINFEYGADLLNWNRFFMEHGGTRGNFGFYPYQLNRWTTPGQVTDVPRLTAVGNNYNLFTNRALEDGSFIRLRSVTLGYTLPRDLLQKIYISNLRVYVMATNLLTITNYTGLDPEVNSAGDNALVRGVDLMTMPQPRTFQFGVNVSF